MARAKTKAELKQEKIKRRWIISGVLFFLLMVALALTMIFSSKMETFFKLRPDLSEIKETALEIHFVDVGQGDAILVRFPNEETMLIDSGTNKSINYLKNYIDNVFFKKKEEKKFDYILLTHGDADHSGGMLEILNTYSVDLFYRPATTASQQGSKTYSDILNKLDELQSSGKTSVVTSTKGITINCGDVPMIEFLSPTESYYNNLNNYSPILMITYSGEKIMLTGDAEAEIEAKVVEDYTLADNLAYLDVDVLKVGHHGSSTSTSQAFLDAVKPEFAVISVAKYNSYGHPSDTTIAKLTNAHVTTYMTSNKGNVICYVNENEESAFAFIQDADGYLYVDWYVIVIAGEGVLVVMFLLCNINNKKFNKEIKKGTKKAVKKTVKNMAEKSK